MDTDPFKELLLQQQQELLEVLESGKSAAGTVMLDQTSVGRVSRMDALQSQAMMKELARRREQLLHEISKALKRIDNSDYGYCEECSEAIAVKRLQINPVALYCIECSNKLEAG